MSARDGVPGANEFGLMVAFLRKQRPAGFTVGEWQAIVTAQIGGNPNGRTRGQIAQELADWFFVFPKDTT